MFTGSGPIKETFKYSMETQLKANTDTRIGSAAVEHLHPKESVPPKEDGADILVLCLHQDHKNGLYLKGCGVVHYGKVGVPHKNNFFRKCLIISVTLFSIKRKKLKFKIS